MTNPPPYPPLPCLTGEELATLYRRVRGREPTGDEVEDLLRWCREWGRERTQADHAR